MNTPEFKKPLFPKSSLKRSNETSNSLHEIKKQKLDNKIDSLDQVVGKMSTDLLELDKEIESASPDNISIIYARRDALEKVADDLDRKKERLEIESRSLDTETSNRSLTSPIDYVLELESTEMPNPLDDID